MIRALLLLACLSAPATADVLPSAFMVSGVAAGDVLNIRAEPKASATVLGTIAPDAAGVEVTRISDDGKWGLVAAGGEGNGWVALKYLEPMPILDPARLPRPMHCLGAEPFWSLDFGNESTVWTTPDTPETALSELDEAVAPAGYFVQAREGEERTYSLTVTREWCSDGMSDREFGFAARLFIESPDGNLLAGGCCSLDSR